MHLDEFDVSRTAILVCGSGEHNIRFRTRCTTKRKGICVTTNGAGREGGRLLGKVGACLLSPKLIICQPLVADSATYCLRHARQKISYVVSIPNEGSNEGRIDRAEAHPDVHLCTRNRLELRLRVEGIGHAHVSRICDKRWLALLAGHQE